MAFLKDKFEKVVSYFDTDEVSDVEELEASLPPHSQNDAHQQPVKPSVQPEKSYREAAGSRTTARSSQYGNPTVSRTQHTPSSNPQRDAGVADHYRRERKQSHHTTQQQEVPSQPTIALKYPRRYEDATEIVDLLAGNECVLIDFQYMLEAQARRCLDFVDGASRVLSGNLQKVGSSMYLLTPQFVLVDIEEMTIPGAGQEVNFDYDMKRR